MIDGSSLLTFAHQPLPNGNCDLRYTTLRRKSAYLWDSARGAGSGYPSPPMSSPPSPKRRTSDLTLPSTLSQQIVPIATAPTSVSTPAHSLEQTTTSIASLGITQAGHPAYHPPASFVTGSGSGAGPLTSAAGQYYSAAYPPPALTAAQTTSQASRKAKTHVASACVNCKRAHLSCDVQRPCARCISSGKQDTCYDVAHKKRGRPRLRDEGQFGLERTMSSTKTSTTATASMTTPTRPIAATRSRRAESFRSIQSMTSEESPSYGPPSTPSYLPRPPPPFQTPLTYQPPLHLTTSPHSEPEVPTALLDLDFVIIRANTSFRQIMADNRDLTNHRLHEIAAPADTESFMSIRTRLRGEREVREPSYLPPIVSSGEDPLGGISDAEVERLTQGFSDHTYTWVQLQPGPRGSQTFPARVRLAKAATYFVVVSLPSFRPVEPPPPHPPIGHGASPYTFGPPLTPREEPEREQPRHAMAPSAPPLLMKPFDSAHAPPHHLHRGQPPLTRTYPPPTLHAPPSYWQPHSTYMQPSQPTLAPPLEPRPAPTNPTIKPPPYVAPSLPTPLPASGRDIQLPPITASPALTQSAGPASLHPIQASPVALSAGGAQRTSDSEEDSETQRQQSPRKRRRMGIDEVLQK